MSFCICKECFRQLSVGVVTSHPKCNDFNNSHLCLSQATGSARLGQVPLISARVWMTH